MDGRGLRTSLVYDPINRQTAPLYADGTRVSLAYDAASRRTALGYASGRTSWTFDALGRVQTVQTAAGRQFTLSAIPRCVSRS